MATHFSTGDTIVLRYLEHGGGIGMATPCRVIEDCRERTVLYTAAGSRYKRADWARVRGHIDPVASREIIDAVWDDRDVLRIMYPETPYSVWLLWDVPQRSLAGWYVNLEAPFARTEIGIDTQDHELDVVIRPDFSWYWKDEDDLQDEIDALDL